MISLQLACSIQLLRAFTFPQYPLSISNINPSKLSLLMTPTRTCKRPFGILVSLIQTLNQ